MFFSKQQTGFNARHWLSVMLEKFRKAWDKSGDYAALLAGLSKAFDFEAFDFDCIPHDFIIAKRHKYSFDTTETCE